MRQISSSKWEYKDYILRHDRGVYAVYSPSGAFIGEGDTLDRGEVIADAHRRVRNPRS